MRGEPLVQLDAVRKSFVTASGARMAALDGVSLRVAPQRIFGVIGPSGAGKSTLIRCVNLLERPDAGRVVVAGAELTALPAAALRAARRGIGMVFQHFNLLSSRTVAENIALPLEIAGVARADREARVAELLPIVGLADKAQAYPTRLSGGQKQRVGIARALGSRPGLRDRLQLTVLLITHEMAVVKAICDEVAVLEAGRIVEQGRVFDVFTRPQTALARRFVGEVIGDAIPPGTLARLPEPGPSETRRLLRILFAGPASTRAVISEVSRRFGLDVNILSGRIDAIGGEPFGLMAVAAYGPLAGIEAAVAWMLALGLVVDDIA